MLPSGINAVFRGAVFVVPHALCDHHHACPIVLRLTFEADHWNCLCTPDIVEMENRLVEMKKAFVKQEKDVNLPIFRTDDDSLTALRIRDQRWHTVYEDHLKWL